MVLAQASARWASLSHRNRVIIGIALPLLIGMISLSTAFLHPLRVSLFAEPLSAAQMTEVQTALAEWNLPFTPVDHNIVIDASQRNAILLRLSIAGLPRTPIQTSHDALSQIGALTPESVIDAQTRDGLSGDIALALRGIDGILDAQVIIAPAQRGNFADQAAADASASVRIHLRPGARLERDQRVGITRFVAAAVPGLQPERVTLLDDAGISNGDSGVTSVLQNQAQSALDAIFGAGATIVRVHTTREQESIQRSDEQHSPLGTLNALTSTEHFSAPGKQYAKQTVAQQRGSRRQRLDIQRAAGGIARLSVAVAVDASRHLDLGAIQALVAASVGIDPKRGDSVVVAAVPFTRELQPKIDSWWLAYGAIVPLLPSLAIALALVLCARLLSRPLFRWVDGWSERAALLQQKNAVIGYSPARVRQVLRDEPPHAAAAIISALPTATAAAVLELYPEAERRAILARMQRENSSLIPDAEEVLAHV